MTRLLKWVEIVFLASAIVFFIGMLVCFLVILMLGWNRATTIYWLAYSDLGDCFGLTLVVLISAIVAHYLLIVVSAWRLKVHRPHQKGGAAVGLILFANLLLLGMYFLQFWQHGPLAFWRHLQTVRTDFRVYNLLLYDSDPAEGYNAQYILYECDSLNFMCQTSYSIFESTGNNFPEVEEIFLVHDAASDSVSLSVNGEIAYPTL